MSSSCGVLVRQFDDRLSKISESQLFVQGRRSTITEDELAWAKTAWVFFQTNYSESTGVVAADASSKVISMWTVADTIGATHAAFQLGLLEEKLFDERVSTLLHFLNTMPLFRDRLPNRYYHSISGKKVDTKGRENEVGWSAVDIGRLLIWLKILQQEYPHLSEYVDKSVLRWNFCDLIDKCGALYGGRVAGKELQLVEEGRLGYEEYAALGFQVWGFDSTLASSIEPYGTIKVEDVDIYYDLRDPRLTGMIAPVLSGPYLYSGLEFNWDRADDLGSLDSQHSNRVVSRLARSIYEAQERRYENHRILTARTDHVSAKRNRTVYDSVFADGFRWNTLSESGEYLPDLALVSTKAVFGMWALWQTPYTDRLMESVKSLHSTDKGWFEGRYELSGAYDRSLTASTNALVLESILYRSGGKIFGKPRSSSHYEILLEDVFKWPNRCFPAERTQCDA